MVLVHQFAEQLLAVVRPAIGDFGVNTSQPGLCFKSVLSSLLVTKPP